MTNKFFYYILTLLFIPFLGFSQIIISGDAEIVASGNTNIIILGNWTNNANNTGFSAINGSSKTSFSGTTAQTIGGTKTTIFNNFEINNTNGVELGTDITISDLSFSNGIISTLSNKIDMPIGATITGANSNSFINGTIAKTGNDAFKFEVGNNLKYAPIEISAPSGSTDIFTAKYYWNMPPDNTSIPSNILKISGLEYWSLNRTNGTSSVDVTLHWENSQESVIGDILKHLFLVHHDGVNSWDNAWGEPDVVTQGLGSTTTPQIGSITKSNISNFGYFTFGTDNINNNMLPIELLYFTAICQKHGVLLEWETASELNDDYFTILRSTNAIDFVGIDTIKGSGSTNTTLDYTYIDWGLTNGTIYYELEQTDYNGTHTYYEKHEVNCVDNIDSQLLIYPNPTKDYIKIISPNKELNNINIYNTLGQDVTFSTTIISHHETVTTIDISNLSNGLYTIKTEITSSKILKE